MLSRSKLYQVPFMLLIGAVSFISLSVPTTHACSIDGKGGFAPENNLKIPVNYVFSTAATMDETMFNDIIGRVENFYSPIVSSLGGKLSIERNWTDPTVNAYAKREGASEEDWIIAMFGGLARHPDMTNDGFMLVVCHEMGHQIGGAPKYGSAGARMWASNEGQADYWGALKCMRRVLVNDNNEAIMRSVAVPAPIADRCTKSYKSPAEQALCKRVAMAGVALGHTLATLARDNDPSVPVPAPETPNKSRVKKTYDGHPEAQCRLDTYFAGAACTVDPNKDTSDTDPVLNTCASENRAKVGTRPVCWYKPGSYKPSPAIFSADRREELKSQIYY